MWRQTHYGRRIDETFGEDPRIISDIIFRIVKGFQGDILNENSVTTTSDISQVEGHVQKDMILILKKDNLTFIRQKVV